MVQIFTLKKKIRCIAQYILSIYVIFCLDKDGFITLTEYKNIESELYEEIDSDTDDLFGEKCNEEDAKEFIETADIDGDGTVDYEEFRRFVLKKLCPSRRNLEQ